MRDRPSIMNAPMTGTKALDALTALFAKRGLTRSEPPILQPAETFLDLTGEDIRRRLFFVQGPDGRELCLRPDFTIPVSRAHLASDAGLPAGYCYLGPVFRHRGEDVSGEFLQAGIERFGDADREAADADVVAFALEAAGMVGRADMAVRLGDPGLVMDFVAALDLPAPWPRRIRAAFGRAGGFAEALEAPSPVNDGRTPFLAALGRSDPEAARAAVEEMASVAGIAPLGGRTPEEIAERLLEQARLAADGGLEDRAREVLTRLSKVAGSPDTAAGELRDIARDAGLDVARSLDAFARRNDLMAERGVPLSGIDFSAVFGRRLDYYTGFVFEILDPAAPETPAIGGGRYDLLLSMLGAPAPVPAVGCSIWIDRLIGDERS